MQGFCLLCFKQHNSDSTKAAETSNVLDLTSVSLDLTKQMYNYEVEGTGVPRQPHIPESALLIFRRHLKQKLIFYATA